MLLSIRLLFFLVFPFTFGHSLGFHLSPKAPPSITRISMVMLRGKGGNPGNGQQYKKKQEKAEPDK